MKVHSVSLELYENGRTDCTAHALEEALRWAAEIDENKSVFIAITQHRHEGVGGRRNYDFRILTTWHRKAHGVQSVLHAL